MTSVLDRLVTAGWVRQYAMSAEYRVTIAFTEEGLRVLGPVRDALQRLGALSDIEMKALAWVVTTQLDKPWSRPAS